MFRKLNRERGNINFESYVLSGGKVSIAILPERKKRQFNQIINCIVFVINVIRETFQFCQKVFGAARRLGLRTAVPGRERLVTSRGKNSHQGQTPPRHKWTATTRLHHVTETVSRREDLNVSNSRYARVCRTRHTEK